MSIAEQDPNAAKVALDTGAARTGRGAGSARASTASRTRASSAARAATSTTSSCPGCSTRRSSAARTPTRRIVSIDTSKAEALPGVVRVVTGKDVAEHAAPLPSFGAGPIIQDMIAIEKVRHYGETVAAVIAENRYVAEDACELIEVDYEQLPGRARPGRGARGRTRRSCTRQLGTNIAYERTFSFGEVDQAFAEADRAGARRSCTGRARPGCRWTRTARSATTTPARAS